MGYRENDKEITTRKFFREAAKYYYVENGEEKVKSVFLSSDEAYEKIKKMGSVSEKEKIAITEILAAYACYESYEFFCKKRMKEDDKDAMATKTALELLKNIYKFNDSLYSRRGLVHKILNRRYIDYCKTQAREMNDAEKKEYLRGLPEEVVHELIYGENPIKIYISKNDKEILTDDFSYIMEELPTFDIDTLEDKKQERAYLVATIHTLFSLDRAPYKLIMYLYKGLCLSELKKTTGGLVEKKKVETVKDGEIIVENHEIGALSMIEGRRLGEIKDSLPSVLEEHLSMDKTEHFSEYELRLMFDPLDDKLRTYNRIDNSYGSVLHYEKTKDAREDACDIKKAINELRPQIEQLSQLIYSHMSVSEMNKSFSN